MFLKSIKDNWKFNLPKFKISNTFSRSKIKNTIKIILFLYKKLKKDRKT